MSRARRLAVAGLVVAAAAGLVAAIATRPLPKPPPTRRWVAFSGPSYRVELPAQPVEVSAGVETAVVGSVAYTVVSFPATGPAPLAAALAAIGKVPGRVTSSHVFAIGPFTAVDLTADLGDGWLHARMLLFAPRGYLVGEITRSPLRPPDLDRMLASFDPVVG